jgi:ribosomal protein S18 acetylase RimI-like enzyme
MKIEKVIIRKATHKDFKELYNFFELVNNDFIPPISKRRGLPKKKEIENFTKKMIRGKKSTMIIFESNRKINGIICFSEDYWKNKNIPHIVEFAVHKSHRHKGVGTLLLEYIFNLLERKGYKSVTIRTWSTNKLALNLYRKVGFKKIKTIKNDRGKGIDTIYFKKKL